MLAQKRLSAAAVESKPIVGNFRISDRSNKALVNLWSASAPKKIIGKAMSCFDQRPPHLVVKKDEFVAIWRQDDFLVISTTENS